MPAAFTIDRFHAVRLAPFAVMLVVVTIPAVDALREAVALSAWARGLASALVVLASVQFAFFVQNYTSNGHLRSGRYEADLLGCSAELGTTEARCTWTTTIVSR